MEDKGKIFVNVRAITGENIGDKKSEECQLLPVFILTFAYF